MPLFAGAHTFRALPNGPKKKTLGFLRTVPPDAGKADLIRGYWNPKRKLVITTHFFRIFKLRSI